MKSDDIIAQARKELKEHLVYETKYLYALIHHHYPNFEKDEEWTINFSEIVPSSEKLVVHLTDLYDETYDEYTLNSINVTNDDNVFFRSEFSDHHWGELKIDELAEITRIVEKSVLKYLNKL